MTHQLLSIESPVGWRRIRCKVSPNGSASRGRNTRRGIVGVFGLGLLTVGVASCASYQEAPLPQTPDLAATIGSQPPIGVAVNEFSMVELAAMAVRRNPDLMAERRAAEVASAQAFAAGLLPDPDVGIGLDITVAPGRHHHLIDGFGLSIAQDIGSLLTHGAALRTAADLREQARLNMLWSEWQTIETVCGLDVQIVFDEEREQLLKETTEKLLLEAHTSGPSLPAKSDPIDDQKSLLDSAWDSESQLFEVSRDELEARHNLNTDLGLLPDVPVSLAALGEPEAYSRIDIAAALARVSHTRPDLLALQAGYLSQEETVRRAVLQQFPDLTLSLQAANDVFGTHSLSPGLSMPLPIFGSARAAVAVEQATRAQLRAEYVARLDQVTADAWRVWGHATEVRAEIAQRQATLWDFQHVVDLSAETFRTKQISSAKYLIYLQSLRVHRGELLALEQLLWADTISLHTLLGLPYRTAAKP